MKVYKVEDLETFETDECGYLICPTGDYSQIKRFGKRCDFGGSCKFGESCSFGDGCNFGISCSFGDGCSFDDCCNFHGFCQFGESCRFGENCSFGKRCNFGKLCSFCGVCQFGYNCNFGMSCNFGVRCSFGDGCNLENNHKFENIQEQVDRVLKIDYIGSREICTYFFKTLSEIYVRCGFFFGTIAEFENKVKETHKDNERYCKEYLKAIDYVKVVFVYYSKCKVDLICKLDDTIYVPWNFDGVSSIAELKVVFIEINKLHNNYITNLGDIMDMSISKNLIYFQRMKHGVYSEQDFNKVWFTDKKLAEQKLKEL